MENRTETCLNTKLNHWRASYTAKAELSQEHLDELESHLRDEIDNLIQNGLTQTEAFLVATHRIGDKEEVIEEFRKVNKFGSLWHALKPYAFGAFAFMALKSLHSFLMIATSLLSNELGYSNFTLISILTSLVFFVCLCLLIYAGFHSKSTRLNSTSFLILVLSIPILSFLSKLFITKYLDISTAGLIVRDSTIIQTCLYLALFFGILGFKIVLYFKNKTSKNLRPI